MRYKRRDKNTDEIKEAIEECGFSYIDMHNAGCGFPDCVAVRKFGELWCSVPIEIKGKNGKLTKDQEVFDEKYPGLNHLCRTGEDVERILNQYVERFMPK